MTPVQDDPRPSPTDPTSAFGELGRIELGSTSLTDVMSTVAALVKASLPGAAEVSVTLLNRGVAETAAHTGDLALALDERQYEAGHGPCLDAAAAGTVFSVPDVSGETRWPSFCREAERLGVRSTLSVGMPIREAVTGGLNIYSTEISAFDDEDVETARTFAGYAAVALANVHLYEATAALAAQMSGAMTSRAVIEQAKGIIVAQQAVSPDKAFDILARASQSGNRKLRDIAQSIVDGAQNKPTQ